MINISLHLVTVGSLLGISSKLKSGICSHVCFESLKFSTQQLMYDSKGVFCLGLSSVAAGECGGNRGGCQFACRLYAGRIARGDRMGTRVILKVPSSLCTYTHCKVCDCQNASRFVFQLVHIVLALNIAYHS